MTDIPSRTRSLSFGAVADNYDRYRPTYPAELVADIYALVPGRRVVEIGSGTGIATSRFVAYRRDVAGSESTDLADLTDSEDLQVTCIEPDPEMARVLAGKFVDNPRVQVTVATLESWSADRGSDAKGYHGLICAQAWHWTAPETRWRDAAAALLPKGLIALFWNRDGYADPQVSTIITQVYERYGIADRAVLMANRDDPNVWPDSEMDASLAAGFREQELRSYEWADQQTVVDHVARMNTVSAHLILPPEVRAALTKDLLVTLDQHTGGKIDLAMRTDLALARKR